MTMARRKRQRSVRPPNCSICNNERRIAGPDIVKKFANGPTRIYPQSVPCSCVTGVKPAAAPMPAPPAPSIDQQQRAAGEGGA